MTAISRLLLEFLESEKTAGLALVFCTVASLLISNSPLGDHYVSFWHRSLDLSFPGVDVTRTVVEWINDGLMTVFFLLVGLEIERELYKGELSGIRNALLPVLAAFGGMVIPALIHFSLNAGTDTQSGFGIPVATDIAFALGILSLLGNRVPLSLTVLLTALAIIDDLGAIIVIALFYAHGFSALHLGIAAGLLGFLILLNRMGIDNLFWYLAGGLLIWFFMLNSGIHPTITGVALAFAIPFRQGDDTSPSCRMEHYLGKPVAFLILPLFALANTAMIFQPGWYDGLTGRNSLGIIGGLVLGKPLGITLFTFLAVKSGLGKLADDLCWTQVVGMGILAGIGFTMSIFITNLAFVDQILREQSKVAILGASLIAGITGLLVLRVAGQMSCRPE